MKSLTMNKFFSFGFLALLLSASVSLASAQAAQSDAELKEENPAEILVSYYDAVNARQYRRAYNLWQNPPQSYTDFAKGYGSTRNVRLLINPNTPVEGAAGSLYKEVPTVLISTMKNGSRQIFSGCYTLRRSNLRLPENASPKDGWQIYKGDLKIASRNADTGKLLAEACSGGSSDLPNGDDKSSRVPGVLGSDLPTARQSVRIPADVQANRDFEITVTTSGNGCFSEGETSVVLGEDSADIFVYDVTTANRPAIVCTMILKNFMHKATLKFAKRGDATIRVWGRKQGGRLPFGEPLMVEKRIRVK